MYMPSCAKVEQNGAGRRAYETNVGRLQVAVQPAFVVHNFDPDECAPERRRRLHRHPLVLSVEPCVSWFVLRRDLKKLRGLPNVPTLHQFGKNLGRHWL